MLRKAPLEPYLSCIELEHVGEEVCQHFYNRVFDPMEAALDFLYEGLKQLIDMPKRLPSITYFPRLKITS